MNIQNLVEMLLKYDPKTPVLVDGYEYGLDDLEAGNIRSIRFERNVNSSAYAGPHDESDEGEVGLVLGRGSTFAEATRDV